MNTFDFKAFTKGHKAINEAGEIYTYVGEMKDAKAFTIVVYSSKGEFNRITPEGKFADGISPLIRMAPKRILRYRIAHIKFTSNRLNSARAVSDEKKASKLEKSPHFVAWITDWIDYSA